MTSMYLNKAHGKGVSIRDNQINILSMVKLLVMVILRKPNGFGEKFLHKTKLPSMVKDMGLVNDIGLGMKVHLYSLSSFHLEVLSQAWEALVDVP